MPVPPLQPITNASAIKNLFFDLNDPTWGAGNLGREMERRNSGAARAKRALAWQLKTRPWLGLMVLPVVAK